MKLRNPTKRMVFLRDDINKTLVTIKPGEVMNVAPHMRSVFAPYVQAFELRWELDDSDLPPGMSGIDNVMGTHQYYQKHESTEIFDANKALAQSDSAEIAEIWKQNDTVRMVPHEATQKPNHEETGDFLFFKEGTHQEGTSPSFSEGENENIIESPYTGAHIRDEASALPEDESSPNGPDYLRNILPDEGLEDFGTIEGSDLVFEEGLAKLPDDAPVTISQLQLSTKAQLWEMADKLGVDANGTKREIIDRICRYHWKTHATKLQLANNN